MEKAECYIPGNVNIDQKERNRRFRNGWVYLLLTLLSLILIVLFEFPGFLKMLIYIPATLSALGFLQGRSSFCVYYGLKGESHLNNKIDKINDPQNLIADKKASVNILIVSLSIGFLITLLAYLFF